MLHYKKKHKFNIIMFSLSFKKEFYIYTML